MSKNEEQARNIIRLDNVSFSYQQNQDSIPALRNISLSLREGEHLAVIGHNGSGKSTLARICTALELPDEGSIFVEEITLNSLEDVYRIRQLCGLVFQNPDDQIVASSVEQDVAFGPENLGLSTAEIRNRVDSALNIVKLSTYAKKSPHNLSGGQKQKLSIAGVLAMCPRCLILDEATSMLDPQTAKEIFAFVRQLCRSEGIALINITHNMEEAYLADRVILMSRGDLLIEGSPDEVFAKKDLISLEHLALPFHLAVANDLAPYIDSAKVHSLHDLCLQIKASLDSNSLTSLSKELERLREKSQNSSLAEDILSVEHLSYTYDAGGSGEHQALRDISFNVRRGEIFVLCGHSGSGKSTLISHFNGLLKAQEGSVRLGHLDCSSKKDIPEVRKQVGMVFQYPERQLFAETVAEDISFGLVQNHASEEEIQEQIEAALTLLKLSPEILSRSPFDLSGGQQRRVAIAGILVMEPKILVLDEPAAGLDPLSHQLMIELIRDLNQAGHTIVMVTHNMEDALRLADRIAVLKEGQLLALDTPEEIFRETDLLEASNLLLPQALQFSNCLSGELDLSLNFHSREEIKAALLPLLAKEESDV